MTLLTTTGTTLALSALSPIAFTPLEGIRLLTLEITPRLIEQQAITQEGWQTLTPAPALRRVRLKAQGIIHDAAVDALLYACALGGTALRARLTQSNATNFSGEFFISAYTQEADHSGNGACSISFSLESHGEISVG